MELEALAVHIYALMAMTVEMALTALQIAGLSELIPLLMTQVAESAEVVDLE